MESKWNKKRVRKARLLAALKSLRIPLMTAAGVFAVAFFVIPFALNGISMPASLALEIDAPASPAPIPTPAQGGVVPELPAQGGVVPETPSVGVVPESPAVINDPASAYAVLEFGSTQAQVALIQQRLMNLWYMESDEPTEYFGNETQAAIRRFQRSHYMKETGVADAQTQAVLFSESAKPYVLEKGYSGEDVRSLQARLEELGFYADKLNGYFGTATHRAVSAFQLKNKIEVSGIVDFDTKDRVFSPAARPAVDPTPTPSPSPTKTPRVTPTATPKPGTTSRPGTPTPAGGGWGPPETAAPATSSPANTQTPVTAGGDVEDFISFAKQQLGKPYLLGGRGPDEFDCSGFVYYCLRGVGVSVPRYTASGFSQVDSWPTVYGKENLVRGDLLFYKTDGSSSTYVTHVAIWLGGGQILHASASAGQICYTTWSTWSVNNFLFAKRVF